MLIAALLAIIAVLGVSAGALLTLAVVAETDVEDDPDLFDEEDDLAGFEIDGEGYQAA